MKKILPAVFVFVLFSCNNKLDKIEYVGWLQDENNGYHVRKNVDGFVFDIQYQSPEYLSLISGVVNNNNQILDSSPIFHQFKLTITPDDKDLDLLDVGVGSLAEKQQLLYYYAYLFQQDIYMEQGDGRVPCSLLHFERQVDLKSGRTFVLGFEGKPLQDAETVIVITSDHLGSLPIKLSFSNKEIPSLVL